MSKQITIAGTTYTLPTQGDDPEWGESVSDIIEALAAVSNEISGSGDIPTTTFTPANNVTTPTIISGAQFDTGTILSSLFTYTVNRATSTTELTERGTLTITFIPSTNTFDLARTYGGDAGIEFTINSTGQILYTTSNLSGSSYNSEMIFSAKSTLK